MRDEMRENESNCHIIVLSASQNRLVPNEITSQWTEFLGANLNYIFLFQRHKCNASQWWCFHDERWDRPQVLWVSEKHVGRAIQDIRLPDKSIIIAPDETEFTKWDSERDLCRCIIKPCGQKCDDGFPKVGEAFENHILTVGRSPCIDPVKSKEQCILVSMINQTLDQSHLSQLLWSSTLKIGISKSSWIPSNRSEKSTRSGQFRESLRTWTTSWTVFGFESDPFHDPHSETKEISSLNLNTYDHIIIR
jgi:hypothetical protein